MAASVQLQLCSFLFFCLFALFALFQVNQAEQVNQADSCDSLRLGQSKDRRGHSGAGELPRHDRLGGVPPSSKHQLSALQRDGVQVQRGRGGLQQNHPLQERERLFLQSGRGFVSVSGLARSGPLLPGIPCSRTLEVLYCRFLWNRHFDRLHIDRHADRGSGRRIELHRGLLRCPADPPVHHQPDIQEATPVSVNTPGHAHRNAVSTLKTSQRTHS